MAADPSVPNQATRLRPAAPAAHRISRAADRGASVLEVGPMAKRKRWIATWMDPLTGKRRMRNCPSRELRDQLQREKRSKSWEVREGLATTRGLAAANDDEHRGEIMEHYAHVLEAVGRHKDALELAEEALKLNEENMDLKEWLNTLRSA